MENKDYVIYRKAHVLDFGIMLEDFPSVWLSKKLKSDIVEQDNIRVRKFNGNEMVEKSQYFIISLS